MNGINRVSLLGNLGFDPELKYTQSGQAVMRCRLATNEVYGKGEARRTHTEWHTVIIWGSRAEGLSKILQQGTSCLIEGRLRTRSWEDREGTKRYTTEVHATNVVVTGKGRPREEQQVEEEEQQSMFSEEAEEVLETAEAIF